MPVPRVATGGIAGWNGNLKGLRKGEKQVRMPAGYGGGAGDAMRRGTGLLLSCALVLAGCASTGTGDGVAGGSVSPSASVPVPVASPATPAPEVSMTTEVLVEFRRQGGFAGLSDQLVVHTDGAFDLVRAKPPVSRHGQLTGAELADLRHKLARADLGHQPAEQTSAKGSDLFRYLVSAGGSQVVTQDGSVPPALNPLLSTLSELVSRYGT
jgi:hypothetical protein